MGDDDMFSSDLSDDQLRMRLGHMSNTPCQVCLFWILLFDTQITIMYIGTKRYFIQYVILGKEKNIVDKWFFGPNGGGGRGNLK